MLESLLRKRRLILTLLGLLILWLLHPWIATVVYNNVGSVLLNRALLALTLAPEDRMTYAVQAGQSFQNALAWDTHNSQAHYNLGTLYDFLGDRPSATRAWSQAATQNTHDTCARFALGKALAAQGYEERAIQEWRAAGAAIYFVKQGLGSTYEGDYAGAIEQYERALAIDPNLSEGYYYLGRALSALGRREEALTALESAAELQPPSFPHRYLLWGEVHIARGEWTAALAALGRAATLAPWDPLPHYRMGWVLSEKLGDRESAIVHFQQALRRDPGYTPARLSLGRLYAEPAGDGQQATSFENCDEAARWLSPLLLPLDEPLAPYDSGGESTSQSVEARSARQAHTLVGGCLLRQGREEEALPHLERALALNPDSVDAHLILAQAYVQAHLYREAIDVYRQVLVLQPDNDQARQSLEALGWFETTDDAP